MTYDNNVPQAQQTIAFTQPLINTNFAVLATEQKVNHTWTDVSGSNAIAGEADGSHQKLHMPAQVADITGALPTGITAIQYAKDNALYAWDGTYKCAVSAVSVSGLVTLQTTNTPIVPNVPANCIGFVVVFSNIFGGPDAACGSFMTLTGGLANCINTSSDPLFKMFFSFSGQTIQVKRTDSGVVNPTVPYKIIYWPI